MRNDKPEPTIPVDNIASDQDAVLHWHSVRYGPDETGHSVTCHGTDPEAARNGYIDLLNLNRADLTPCTEPDDTGRCARDECWTCTIHELIDTAVHRARTQPRQQLHHLAYTYGRPLEPHYRHTIETAPAVHCTAS